MNRKIWGALVALVLAVGTGFAAAPAVATGGGYEPCVPSDAWTETIVVKEAHWQRYSWTGGPWTSPYAPPFPGEGWQPNVEGDPHGVGVEGGYFRSHGNSGNGDWFYLEWIEAETKTIEHPAVECPDPEQPEPLVEVFIDYTVDCDLLVTRTEVVFTTPYVLIDGEWVLADYPESMTSSTSSETMTVEEIEAITDGPVIIETDCEEEPPVEEPPTEEPPVEKPPVKVTTRTTPKHTEYNGYDVPQGELG